MKLIGSQKFGSNVVRGDTTLWTKKDIHITNLGREQRYPRERRLKILYGLNSNPHLFTSVHVSVSTAGGLPSFTMIKVNQAQRIEVSNSALL